MSAEVPKVEQGGDTQFADRILTPQQYIDHPHAHINEPSYTVDIERGPKHLMYFGVSHTNDLENPLFDEIKQKFDALKPTKIYFEGWELANRFPDKAREYVARMTHDEAKREGEPMYVLKLAVDAGIPFESPEPSDTDVRAQLLQEGYTERDLFYQMFHQIMNQYLREHVNRSLEEAQAYLEPYFKRMLADDSLNKATVETLVLEALKSIDLEGDEFYRDNCDPIPWLDKPMTRSKEVSAKMTVARDRYAIGRIAAGLKEHDRVLVVYGRSHAISLEPALRALMDAQ